MEDRVFGGGVYRTPVLRMSIDEHSEDFFQNELTLEYGGPKMSEMGLVWGFQKILNNYKINKLKIKN